MNSFICQEREYGKTLNDKSITNECLQGIFFGFPLPIVKDKFNMFLFPLSNFHCSSSISEISQSVNSFLKYV